MFMNTLPIGRYRFFQALQPLSLLTQITGQSTKGCLKVFSASASWLFYFDEGKLIYACYADKMFDLLYKNLQRLSKQIPTLQQGVYKQVRAIFETGIDNKAIPNPDYLAICWLVSQKYITPPQAGRLIEQMSLEVMHSFLRLQEGSYEFTHQSFLDNMPKFCHLDQFLLIENCHKQSRNPHNIQSQAQHQHLPNSNPQPRSSQPKSGPQSPNHNSILPPRLNINSNGRQQSHQQSVAKKPYTVFCVSNSSLVLSNIKSCLDEQFFSFIGVSNSLKALIQIIRIKPDLILLDTEMTHLTGYELCSLLRKHSYFQTKPVILIAEQLHLVHRWKAKVVRASGSLAKPFTPVELLKIIFRHIK